MSSELILLTPLLVLLIFVVFGFTGCSSFSAAAATPAPPPPVTPPTQPPAPYADSIKATSGFLALWPMNETSGIKAAATSSLINLDGEYKPGATPGKDGAFLHKEPNANFAPELNGGYVEVPFSVHVNPSTDPIRFSVELWVKPAAAILPGVEQIVVSSHHTAGGGNQRGYEIALVGTGAGHATVRGRIFHINDGAKTADVILTQGDPLAWRHVVLTYDEPAKELILYATVTGTVFDKTKAAKLPSVRYSPVQAGGGERPLRFGAGHLQAGAPEKFFLGRLDEVAFYQAVVPDVTVEDHFKRF